MKKHRIILLLYLFFAAFFVSLSLILTVDRNTIFWIGFSAALFSQFLSAAVTLSIVINKNSDFSIGISIFTVSAVYPVSVIIVNVLFGYMLDLPVNIFISIHIICLSVYLAIIVLLTAAKRFISKKDNKITDMVIEKQSLIYEFEHIKSKLLHMETGQKKKVISLIDDLLDELRFSSYDCTENSYDLDKHIHSMTVRLSSEIDNLILINSEDLTSLENIIYDIMIDVKDRNMQIELMNRGI